MARPKAPEATGKLYHALRRSAEHRKTRGGAPKFCGPLKDSEVCARLRQAVRVFRERIPFSGSLRKLLPGNLFRISASRSPLRRGNLVSLIPRRDSVYFADDRAVKKERRRPSLIIEVLYPYSAEIRRMDEVDKVEIYERAGIPEYLIVDLPRRANQRRFRLIGYRLDSEGHYRPIKPDTQRRLLCETICLGFGVSPQGDRVLVFDLTTGDRILYSEELEAALQTESEARKSAEARARAAEERAERLQEELDRLKGQFGS